MAVAMAESRGDPEADNGTCCHCLFQIHRDWAGKNGAPSDPDKFFEWLNDPYNCAKFAHWIWTNNHHTFAGQWETFDTGAYRRFLGQDPLITVGQRIPIVDDVSDAVDTVTKTIPQFIAALFDPSTYLRIGKGFLGGIFIIIGLASLVFIVANRAINTNPVRNARKLATA
jgi:hypothetical protein